MKGAIAKGAPKAVVKIVKGGLRFCKHNSNWLLSALAMLGIGGLTWATIKGTIKAVKLCEERTCVIGIEVLETVWKCYIPAVGMLILTTTAIICNGKINAKRLAVLTSAYSGTVETLRKVEEKMSEQIGPKKTQKAIDDANAAIAQENAPKDQKDVIATGKGTQLFYLRSTGQWFYSDRYGVELAELKCQKEIEEMQRNGFENYYLVENVLENLGIEEKSEMGQYMGWDVDDFKGGQKLQLYISSDWMDLPWGKEIVGIVNFSPWPVNI